MKPREKKPEIVYRIIDRATQEAQGVYSRACCDEYDFGSVEQARRSNCHDIYEDRDLYAIAKYRVTYELIEADCDRPNNTKALILLVAEYFKQPCPRVGGPINEQGHCPTAACLYCGISRVVDRLAET